MKNKLTKLLTLLLLLIAITCFSLACASNEGENTPPQHTHEYSTEYKFDEANHWFECSCGEKSEVTKHTLTDGKCICGYEAEKKEQAYIRDGEYIYFGRYPQTEVTDSGLKTTLNNLAGTLPTSDNSRNWTSYGYYIEGSVQNYMWYIDVTTGGEKYRGVYFTSYRPYNTTLSSDEDNTYQYYYEGYYINAVYWFKWELIEWRTLSESGENALLMANLILDSQAYQNEYYYDNNSFEYYTNSNGAPSGAYAYNYKYSTIRSWLNDNFYNTAFSELEKEIINTVTVDNSIESTGYDEDDFTYEYSYENTEDKIFLLSYKEVTDGEYGFSSDTYDRAKRLRATDYAQSQGCFAYSSGDYLGNGRWWFRSPSYHGGNLGRFVNSDGNLFYSCAVNSTSNGVVPALQIRLG